MALLLQVGVDSIEGLFVTLKIEMKFIYLMGNTLP